MHIKNSSILAQSSLKKNLWYNRYYSQNARNIPLLNIYLPFNSGTFNQWIKMLNRNKTYALTFISIC